MKLSELKEMVNGAVEFFGEDYEVEIFDKDGEELQPHDLQRREDNIVEFV